MAGLIQRIDKIADGRFLGPVIITVKTDRSVKIALDSILLNYCILRDVYQMSNLDSLMGKVAETVKGKQNGEVLFTSLDMLYAHGKTKLYSEIAKHCNF